jgi:SpoVK/Ycf46/Vps4 family AAA+-type ATPase
MASFWNIPILRLDMGAVYGGLVGQSEANIRKAIRCAEAMSPCILMIDEIEKGLSGTSGSDGDSGTGSRVFGTLLSWMNDKTAEVFVAATANEFDRLPPEMLRKGRFDEIFFVDFPHRKEREEIFKIHVKKALFRKKRDISGQEISESDRNELFESFGFNETHEIRKSDKDGCVEALKGTLSQLSKDYTGSEIEEAVKSAMIDAFADGKREFSAYDVARSLASTVPLIDTMSDRIEAIRAKARECAVAASMGTELEELPTVIEKEVIEAGSEKNKSTYGGRRIDL